MMVCLGRPYHLKLFKGCLPQILLGSFLNNLTHIYCSLDNATVDYYFPRNIFGTTLTYLDPKIFHCFFRDDVKPLLSPLFATNWFRYDQRNCTWRVNLLFVIDLSDKQRGLINPICTGLFHTHFDRGCADLRTPDKILTRATAVLKLLQHLYWSIPSLKKAYS